MIRVAFRFDDPSPSSNQALERMIIAALAAHHCSATVAVIPFRRIDGDLVALTEQRAEHLIEATARGTLEIALHGFSHERHGTASSGKPSEFAGRASVEQVDLIERGSLHLKLLFGDVICGFVPPWNSFDMGTLEALEQLTFSYLSAGWDAPPIYGGNVALLPRTCHLSSLKLAIQRARRFWFLSPIVVAVMHHHDFSESGEREAIIDLRAFDDLLGWLERQPDLRVLSLRTIATQIDAGGWRRALRRYRLQQALPWRLRHSLPEQYVLLTGSWWYALRPRWPGPRL